MKSHKELPPGAQQWAHGVDRALAENEKLKLVIRRLCENAGIDMANPQRGVSSESTPSVQSPVKQKLSSFADVDTYNVADGQVLTWDQAKQVWLPKTRAVTGGVAAVPADTKSVPDHYKNTATNPSFENNLDGWDLAPYVGTRPAGFIPGEVVVDFTRVAGGQNGGYAMQITGTGQNYDGDPQYAASWGVALPVPLGTLYAQASMKYAANSNWQVGFIYDTPGGLIKYDGSFNNFDSFDTWNVRRAKFDPPAGTTRMWMYVGGIAARGGYVGTCLVDSVLTTDGTDSYYDYFDGDFPDGVLEYTWDGAPGNSSSQAVGLATMMAPATFPQSSIIEVTGASFTPNDVIDLYLQGYYKKSVLADASGAFSTTLDVGYFEPTSSGVSASDQNGRYAQLNVQITA